MANGIHIPQKGKVRRSHKKVEQKNITLDSAKYLNDYKILLYFTSPGMKLTSLVNFLPLFNKYVKGENLKYLDPQRFRKFIIKNGNIYWGKNEDVIFPINLLFKQKDAVLIDKEEILYII